VDAQNAQNCIASVVIAAEPPIRADRPALRAGGIRASTTFCDERQDDNPRADASTVRVGVRPLETRARHLGSWRL
jgi:hypothetical protein